MMRLLNGRGPAAPGPERFTLEFACAATDRAFGATFLRGEGERLFRLEAMTPVGRMGLRDRALALLRGSGPAMRVDVADVAMPDACPGCGLAGRRWTLCAWCKAFACAARSRKGLFTCRPSCGVSFETQPLDTLDAHRGGGPAPSDAGGAPRLPNPSVNLLPRR